LTGDDVEWRIPGEWPLAGMHRGHAGLADFFSEGPWHGGNIHFCAPEFIAQIDRVLIVGSSTGKIRPRTRRSRIILSSP